MKLDKYISDLLYRYDLVIIPDFGGIIGRKKNARIDTESYIFSPPHKEISFNSNLIENDGLLMHHVADLLQISDEEALAKIQNQVKQWRIQLQNLKRFKLDQIGVFNLSSDDKILFLPLTTKNYLASAYGLGTFIHKPSIQKNQEIRVVSEQPKEAINRIVTDTIVSTTNTSSLKTPVRKRTINSKKTNTSMWKYAAVFVIGLALMGGGVAFYYNNQQQQPVYQKATFVLPQNFPVVNITGQKETTAEATTENTIEKEYFIISGAFRNKANAEQKVSELIAKNFEASIIGKNKYNLWMVAYEGFATNKEAHKKLAAIRKLQKGVWVFHKK